MKTEQFYDSRRTLIAVKVNDDKSTEIQTLQQTIHFAPEHPMSVAIDIAIEYKDCGACAGIKYTGAAMFEHTCGRQEF